MVIDSDQEYPKRSASFPSPRYWLPLSLSYRSDMGRDHVRQDGVVACDRQWLELDSICFCVMMICRVSYLSHHTQILISSHIGGTYIINDDTYCFRDLKVFFLFLYLTPWGKGISIRSTKTGSFSFDCPIIFLYYREERWFNYEKQSLIKIIMEKMTLQAIYYEPTYELDHVWRMHCINPSRHKL